MVRNSMLTQLLPRKWYLLACKHERKEKICSKKRRIPESMSQPTRTLRAIIFGERLKCLQYVLRKSITYGKYIEKYFRKRFVS